MPERPTPPFDEHDHMEPPGARDELCPVPQTEGASYKAAGKLAGKRALITGGDSGIGRSVAILFAREGADVAIFALPEEADDARSVRERVEAEGRACCVILGDVREPACCQRAVAEAAEALGGLDILVNNAAFQNHVDDPLALTVEQWDRTFKTNIYGYFYMVQAALPRLSAGSVILNTGSITGLEGSPGLLDYAATKGAIHAFTKSLAAALVDKQIRVNCVAPGPVWTPLNPAEREGDAVRCFGADQPMGRPAQPDEIAPMYVFLASNADSSYITGEVMTILGGQTRAG